MEMELRSASKADLEQLLGKALCEASFCQLLRLDIEKAAAQLGIRLTPAQLRAFRKKEVQEWLQLRCQVLALLCRHAHDDAKATGVVAAPPMML